MSVSVHDLLKLPSLRLARVVAGRQSLTKRVTSISVLESADPSFLVDNVFEQGEYFGSEIAITGFLDCQDDIDLQCAAIKRLSEGGEIGLILFYVGVYLPRIDRRVIELADRLGFVLIRMPASKDLRYADVISDVTECLHRDRAQSDFIVSDILARMSTLPLHQRTMNSALRMISDALMASVLLTDGADHLLNLACWPQSIESQIRENLSSLLRAAVTGTAPSGYFSDTRITAFSVTPDTGAAMQLIVIRQGPAIENAVLDQIRDVTRICANIWGQGYNNIAIKELIRSILEDDPLKMNRLAQIFHIDIANIHEMWILTGDTEDSREILKKHSSSLEKDLKSCCRLVFSDFYENDFLLFSSTASSRQEAETVSEEMITLLRLEEPSITLTRCSNLKNTTEVRKAWLAHKKYRTDARRIFPGKSRFSSGQVNLAGECRTIIEKGEEHIASYLSSLSFGNTVESKRIDADTLSVYMLDADFSIPQAAELLHVHPNTVKYRLRTTDNQLGFHHDRMPDNMRLYLALAIRRLLET